MGRTVIMHIDEAPLVRGELTPAGEPIRRANQVIGDLDEGPWINVSGMTPGTEIKPHTHDLDECIYVIEGSLTIGDRECSPGTVVYVERDTEYEFKVGPTGVRFMNIRPGLARIKFRGEPEYADGNLTRARRS